VSVLRALVIGLLLALLLVGSVSYLGNHLGFWRHGQGCAVSAADC
jgi:hypothetical protein